MVFTHQIALANEDEDPLEYCQTLKRLKDAQPRLFAASLDGRILEFSLDSLQIIKEEDSLGGGIWSLAVNSINTLLAIGCEDGSIRIFNIEDGCLEYLKSLEKHDGRILSMDWFKDHIIAGSDHSSIKKYDALSGRCLHRMTVERASSNDETIVWSVKFL